MPPKKQQMLHFASNKRSVSSEGATTSAAADPSERPAKKTSNKVSEKTAEVEKNHLDNALANSGDRGSFFAARSSRMASLFNLLRLGSTAGHPAEVKAASNGASEGTASTTTSSRLHSDSPPPPPNPDALWKRPRFSRFNFSNDFEKGEKLGEGSYGDVYAIRNKKTQKIWAGKYLDMGDGSDIALKEHQLNEVLILDELSPADASKRNRNIVQFEHFYEEHPNFYIIVMEQIKGGELFDRIVSKAKYTEKEARQVSVQVLDALRFMHEKGIMHRDLKPENLMMASASDDTDLRLVDFGLSAKLNPGERLSGKENVCGSPMYVPPEMNQRGGYCYGLEGDIWSLGVIVYVLLAGRFPFNEQAVNQCSPGDLEDIAKKHISQLAVSAEAKDLLGRMLTANPANRITAAGALQHGWVASMGDEELANYDLSGTQKEIKSFNARRKLRGFFIGVLAVVRAKRMLSGKA
jgi:calcium/calmodulin-dependent protein kinase (CaM kinase) II/calcium/calmodulin-dependent protein kinase I